MFKLEIPIDIPKMRYFGVTPHGTKYINETLESTPLAEITASIDV
jgi:hypothetical protein